MPFKSQAQRRFMFATMPKVAKQWQAETPASSSLPTKLGAQPSSPWQSMAKGSNGAPSDSGVTTGLAKLIGKRA